MAFRIHLAVQYPDNENRRLLPRVENGVTFMLKTQQLRPQMERLAADPRMSPIMSKQ
jgi:hypothetical protein